MVRYFFILIALIFCKTLFSQNFEDQWKGFFSFVNVKSISQGNDKIYVGAENAIYTYDLSTQEIETITTINGLSGELISTIHYSEAFNVLFIGYENGLIELVLEDENEILSVVDILDKLTIPPNIKKINHFYEFEDNIYISAQFGISVYNIPRLEFGDSYFIGAQGAFVDVQQVAIKEPFIYAATLEGLRRAEVANENLIDFEAWTQISGGGMLGVQTLGEEVYIARTNNTVSRILPNPGLLITYNNPIQDFTVQGNLLTITTVNQAQAYSEGFTLEGAININNLVKEDIFQAGIALQNNIYVGTQENGLFQVPFGANQGTQILPEGPLFNNPFAIDVTPGQIWVAFGDITVNFNPFPLTFKGISNFEEEIGWTNIPDESLFGASDLVHVKINPINPNEVYFSSFQQGLLKVVDKVPQILYNQDNSPLDVPPNLPGAGIRIFGADFDRDNNLWFTQSRIKEGLIRLTPTGQFQSIDIEDIIDNENELALAKVAISREGFIFFASAENGLIGYNPRDNSFNRIQAGFGSGNLPSVNVRALAFDASNRLWIGTLSGLRVLFNVSGFFEGGNNIDAQEIIILEDGVPQELLFQQSITDIVVDGSNNKWIGTATSGVFYLSPNGQETLLRFTKENSPLPSNNIQDIAIDNNTGRVYFATLNGLVAFEGTSTAPRDNLENVYAFPNPVRPGFTGNVTIDGLTANANVKITDIEGNLVFETTSQGGSVQWDTSAFGKYKVASGVYMVLITTQDALETKIAKIMVIR